ncbi:holo-ACP synthase [Brevibacterium ravenspurgense]|uniref:Holo-[acyl-carrier-protein] synthase n=1 Tax=Brevibacterium ravenspurgense TaxID=479117 RepID=A0A2I1IFD5_9MICO|nr:MULTISPECIES: holo-ACP synthase [Brevibacterium]OFT92355.1 4-phosphopantetheinyl transferase [Brevibacterium sp. HMSC24B04]PKY69829.1 holo-ACP synthase [Brevibacterium ravenspurgense]
MGIIGIGVDIADVPRFQEHIERVPELLDRLLTPAEQLKKNGKRRSPESLAARFSAKEALVKALQFPQIIPWQEAEVVSAFSGAPSFRLSGWVLEMFRQRGGEHVHLSITHDGDRTITYVIVEGSGPSLSPPVDQPAPPVPGTAEHDRALAQFRADVAARREERNRMREEARRKNLS